MTMMSDFISALTGRRIDGIRINAAHETIVFDTDNGPHAFYAEGDCCSSSWIEHFEGCAELVGQTIRRIEHVEKATVESHPEHDCLRTDFLYVFTDKGRAMIDFRNASNGYYSGWLSPQRNWDDKQLAALADF